MAIITNTITRYFPVNVREDLANTIYNISPVDVPFMSNGGRDTCKNTFFEWQVDSLATAVTTNAALDGDDIVSTTDLRVATTRVGNYTQISRKLVEVSGTTEAVDKAGMKSYLSYELAKMSSELKRDMESGLTSDQVANPGATGTARKTAGIGAWLITNATLGTGTLAHVPVMSSGGTNLSGYPSTIAIAGGAVTMTSTILKTAAKNVWAQGGDLKMLMVGPFNKTVFSTFTGIATLYRDVPAGQQAHIVGAADMYLTDFGTLSVVPNRFQPESNAYLLNPDLYAIAYLRNFRTEVMAKTGDAEKRMLLVEYGLKCRAQLGMGVIRDCSTS